jgi:NAD(P)-dependent dehydrogenase (short-subunit alcohol dehydrogenase family)
MQKTWFITGAGRGLGAEIAKAALRAGERVAATARNPGAITDMLGPDNDQLRAIAMDITDRAQVASAIQAAIHHFDAIDVLVNNAGYGQLGFFEENTLEDARAQLETNLLGALNVTWAALPVMRGARKGRIFNISSTAGIAGSRTGSIYCASKFGLEGFSEALSQEVAPFGIFVTVVEPGLFRTGFLDDNSVRFGANPVADYAEQSVALQRIYRGLAGQQKGDPRKLAEAIVQLAAVPKPPFRFAAGSDAVATVERKIGSLREDVDRWRELSISMDTD